MRYGRLAAAIGGIGAAVLAVAGYQAPHHGQPTAHTRHARLIKTGPTTTAECEQELGIACYTPAQIQRAYDLPALYARGITGKGTTIVVVDSFGSPTIEHDLGVFDRSFGLADPPSFRVIAPEGAIPAYDPANSDMSGWAGETTLDVEWAHVIAPGASILLVETPVSETEGVQGFPQIVAAEQYVLRHYHATVISQSFGATEETFPDKGSVEALRGANIAAQKDRVTMLAALGDSGATDLRLDGTTFYTRPVTSWEASDPLVTGVGGTELHLDANGNRTAQDSAWNDTYNSAVSEFLSGGLGPDPDASGGGRSILFPRPWYQYGVRAQTSGARGTPDISMSAACAGAVDTYGPSGWSQTCGDSEATPLFAGIVALAAQEAGRSLGLINPALYRMAAAHDPGIVPVTSGNNTVTFLQNGHEYTVRGYRAQAGYSLVTGVGTIDARLFVPELAALAG
ncbi:MAG TPA: S53 family peptidase [Streptosporangiaceae bacterium]|nr:S53 family peptidase [Streptosporangiaceae bacterium]